MKNKWILLAVFFSVVTLISSLTCTVLVYNSEKNKTEVNSNQIIATNKIYKSTSIVYYQDNNLKLSGLEPGYTRSQTFTITNNNSNTIKYDIEWIGVSSTWNTESEEYNEVHPEEFVYKVTCTNGEKTETREMPIIDKDYEILKDLELKTNKTNECTITITFQQKDRDQSYNLNKSFGGTYIVKVKE